MRTTLALEDDVFGQAVSRLAREGIQARNSAPAVTARPKSKFALLPARSEIITTEHVRKLMDQEGI
jgi:hypothetical protein